MRDGRLNQNELTDNLEPISQIPSINAPNPICPHNTFRFAHSLASGFFLPEKRNGFT
jgi:hypothetical protein